MTGKQIKTSQSSVGPLRKRRKIDLEQKMKIIKSYEGGQSLTNIARELNFAASTVRTILDDSERIKEHVKNSAPLKSTVITKKRSGAIYEMEKLLTTWMEDREQKRLPLTLLIIQAKAKSIFEDIKGNYDDPNAKFVASNGWFSRFKQRASFHNMKITGDGVNANTKTAEKYCKVLQQLIDECGYTAQQIFNISETGLFWKKMPDRMYFSKDDELIAEFRSSKDRFTLLLGSNAAGDCRLKPLLVYHSQYPTALEEIDKDALPVHFNSNPRGWITMSLFEEWFINFFIPEVEKFCTHNNILFNIMLVVDSAPGHPVHLDDLHPNVKVLYLPRNMSSILQPMDRGVIAKFKAYYLRRMFVNALEETGGETGKTMHDFWKSYNIYHAILNIDKAWIDVTKVCLNAAWKKLCPQLVRSFENDETYEQIVDKIVKLANQLEQEIDTGDVDDLIESHGADLSNEDLMELEAAKVKKQTEVEMEVVKMEEPQQFYGKDMGHAFNEISSAIRVLLCFKNFEKDETYKEVADKIVKLAETLDLDIDVDDVYGLIEMHVAELSNKDLIELKESKVKEQTKKEVEKIESQHFNTKEMALAFHEINSAMTRFEKMDPNSSRVFKVTRGVDEMIACYRQIYEEKKMAAFQSSLSTLIMSSGKSMNNTGSDPTTSKNFSNGRDCASSIVTPSSSTA